MEKKLKIDFFKTEQFSKQGQSININEFYIFFQRGKGLVSYMDEAAKQWHLLFCSTDSLQVKDSEDSGSFTLQTSPLFTIIISFFNSFNRCSCYNRAEYLNEQKQKQNQQRNQRTTWGEKEKMHVSTLSISDSRKISIGRFSYQISVNGEMSWIFNKYRMSKLAINLYILLSKMKNK